MNEILALCLEQLRIISTAPNYQRARAMPVMQLLLSELSHGRPDADRAIVTECLTLFENCK